MAHSKSLVEVDRRGADRSIEDPTIELREVSFAYPTRTAAGFRLSIPHWQVAAGERVCLHGASGCGKTTLLHLLSGVECPSTGTVLVGGKALEQMSEPQRRAFRLGSVGFVFQDFPLVAALDALENVLLPYRLHPSLRVTEQVRERARSWLRELGLESRAGRLPRQLAQGERQRVAIARALVTEPPLVLADEPTAGLDPRRTVEVVDLLSTAVERTGATLIWVTHDPVVLERLPRRWDVECWNAGDLEQ